MSAVRASLGQDRSLAARRAATHINIAASCRHVPSPWQRGGHLLLLSRRARDDDDDGRAFERRRRRRRLLIAGAFVRIRPNVPSQLRRVARARGVSAGVSFRVTRTVTRFPPEYNIVRRVQSGGRCSRLTGCCEVRMVLVE